MYDDDGYLGKLAGFLATQSGLGAITVDDLAPARTRDELGIGSLQIILVMANYSAAAEGDVMFRPEWVARLEDVDGIVSVMREIDAVALAPTDAP